MNGAPHIAADARDRAAGGGQARVLFYVQHLLGIGHLKRAATLCRGFEAAGLDVTLVSGGQTVPGLDLGGANFVQLAPVRARDGSFRNLVNDAGAIIDDAFRDARRRALLDTLEKVRPDIIITELFPFGRRQLGFEILPLLEAAHEMRPRPRVVSSVRDILVEPGKPERITEMLDRVERFYDLVLVHGDPSFVPFDETFPPARRIAHTIRYTGYVVEPSAGRDDGGGAGDGEVIVSAGGGASSEPLFRAAMAARRHTRLKDAPWRLLAEHALPDDIFRSLRADAPNGVIVERARTDFTTLLSRCALSISQGGYNTVMDLLAAGARGVIVPYAGGAETEQTLRADRLGARGVLQVVRESDLAPERLARSAEAALDRPPANAAGLDVNGAENSGQILAGLVRGRDRRSP